MNEEEWNKNLRLKITKERERERGRVNERKLKDRRQSAVQREAWLREAREGEAGGVGLVGSMVGNMVGRRDRCVKSPRPAVKQPWGAGMHVLP